jgi:TetR/AcrR family transcriptional regulator, regulator of autoinduction and epiphytic fitness
VIDPRVERSRRVIMQATLDELGEHGYGGLTIEGVAAGAGVGKATVYRHWRNKLELLEAALQELRAEIVPDPHGSPREQVVELYRSLAANLGDSQFSRCVPAVIEAAEHDENVRTFKHRFIAERRQHGVDLLRKAQAAGDIHPDVDVEVAVEAIAGAIFWRRLFTAKGMTAEEVDALLALVLRW